MSIYLDAMGGDGAPEVNIRGAINAAKTVKTEIVLIGDEAIIKKTLKECGSAGEEFRIIHTSQVITMEDDPAIAVRQKKDSSISVGCTLAGREENSAFISAGSTGAILSGALLLTGRIKGIHRPAMGVVLPGKNPVLLIDNGANADCKPEYFPQFAAMGAAYMKALYPESSGSAGLVNIGSEAKKGSALYKEAYEIMSAEVRSFAGNIEPKELLNGIVDVAVCDGFTGNIILKTLEGSIVHLFGRIRSFLRSSSMKAKIAALASGGFFRGMAAELDPNLAGGAPFLGVKGIVLKAHGASPDSAIEAVIKQAEKLIDTKVLESIRLLANNTINAQSAGGK